MESVDPGDSATCGFQAYAVLTVSRAAALLSTGIQLSKRQAAHWAITAYPHWTEWITWAESWRYDAGSPNNPPPDDNRNIKLFVAEVAASYDHRPN